MISRKLAKKKKLTESFESKEDSYYCNPLLVWKPSIQYRKQQRAEENKFLSNFQPGVDRKAISSLVKNHKKSKKRFSNNRTKMR